MSYTHITAAQRNELSVLLRANTKRQEIAGLLQKHRTTIWRELKRNTEKKYHAGIAKEKTAARQIDAHKQHWKFIKMFRDRISKHSTDRVAVVGAGPIGNLVAQVLAKRGRNVTVFNRSPHRLSYLNGTIATSQRLQGLDQFDAIVEASGNVEALQAVLEQSRSDATMVLLGFPYGKLDFQFEDLVGREKVIVGSVGGASEDFRAALDLLPTLHTAPFTEVVLPLSDFQKAWDLHKAAKHLKVLLEVTPS